MSNNIKLLNFSNRLIFLILKYLLLLKKKRSYCFTNVDNNYFNNIYYQLLVMF